MARGLLQGDLWCLCWAELVFFKWLVLGCILDLCWAQCRHERCFCYCWAGRPYIDPRPFLVYLLPHWGEGWRHMKRWNGPQPRKVLQIGQRDIPFHTASYSAYKVWRKERKRGYLVQLRLSSQITITCNDHRWEVWINSCLPMWSSKIIPCFALLLYAFFLSLLNCFNINPCLL